MKSRWIVKQSPRPAAAVFAWLLLLLLCCCRYAAVGPAGGGSVVVAVMIVDASVVSVLFCVTVDVLVCVDRRAGGCDGALSLRLLSN